MNRLWGGVEDEEDTVSSSDGSDDSGTDGKDVRI